MALNRFIMPFADVGNGIIPPDSAQLFFSENGESFDDSPKNTYSDDNGSIPNSNPVVSDPNGIFPDIWLDGVYRVVLKNKLGIQIWEADDVFDLPVPVLVPWSLFSGTPTQISSTQFTLSGDQSSIFKVGLRLKLTDVSDIYCTITKVEITSLTTVTVKTDNSELLSNSLTAVYTTVLTTENPSISTSSINHTNTQISETSIAASVIYKLEHLLNDQPLSIKLFGAVSDGVTDSYPAIAAAITAVSTSTFGGGAVFIPKGNFYADQTIYLPQSVRIEGVGRRAGPAVDPIQVNGSTIIGRHTGAAVISMKGSAFCGIHHLCLYGDHTVVPKTGLCLGRTVGAGSAGRHHISDIVVAGYFSEAAIYSIASEENTFDTPHVLILGGGAKYAFFSSKTDDLSVDNITSGSNWWAGIIYSCNFLVQNNEPDSAAIRMNIDAGTQGWIFKGGFTGMTSGNNSSHIWIHVREDSIYAKDFVFEEVGAESVSNATPPIWYMRVTSDIPCTLRGLKYKNCTLGQTLGGTQFYFYADDNITFDGLEIEAAFSDYPCSLWSIDSSKINIGSNKMIIRDSCESSFVNSSETIIEGTMKNSISLKPVRGNLVFTGSGIDAMSFSTNSQFNGSSPVYLVVEIDTTATPNTFKWSKDSGATYEAQNVQITGVDQALQDGITILFSQTTGLTQGDKWECTFNESISSNQSLPIHESEFKDVIFADGDQTPSVQNGSIFRANNSSSTSISNFDDGERGQEITVVFDNPGTVIEFSISANLSGNAGASWSPEAGDFMTCKLDGNGVWLCSIVDTTT